MTARDDRRPGAKTSSADPISSGQLVPRDLADFATDSTLDMPVATPELIAAGSLGTANTIASARLAGATHDVARPDGTLDLPASDRVETADELAPGQVIGHFVIREKLGEGGMGTVLAARDADLGRPVALKVVKRGVDHPAYRARLLREAQVMARLEHPNVLRVYEVGSDRGRLFIAMELVDGVTLTAWLRVQRRPWRDILAIFAQVGAGLAAVHRAGLVHRDFKPDNVLVDHDGHARVADFGLARLDPDKGVATPELAASLTRTGVLLGTPGYMAPEQYLDGNVDARADQFSFCVALAEALLGVRGRPKQLEDAHWGKVPRAVRAVIARGSSVNAAERFASIDELLAALARAAGHRTLLLGALGAALVAVTAAAALVIASADDREPRSSPPVSPAAALAVAAPAAAAPAVAPPVFTPPIVAPAAPAASPEAEASGSSVVDARGSAPSGSTSAAPRTTQASGSSAAAPRTAAAPAPSPTATPAEPRTPPAKPSPRIAATGASGGDTQVTTMAPVPISGSAAARNAPPRELVRHELVAGHRAAVREAVRELGYAAIEITGDDRDADLRDLADKLAAATDDLERGVIMYAMGQAERSRDDCIAAGKHWAEARKLILESTKATVDPAVREQRRAQAFRFYGRTVVAEGLCALANGRALGTDDKILEGVQNLFGVSDGERAHAWFAMAIAMWETGEKPQAIQLLRQATRYGDAKLRQIIERYVAAVGVTFS